MITSWWTPCLFHQQYSQMSRKISMFWHQISMGNLTLCRKDIHTLLLEYFPTSLICIRMIWRASDCILDPHVSTHCHFYKIYTPISSKIRTDVLKLDPPGKIWLSVTRTDIHCLLSVPWLPFNVQELLEELLSAFSITSWSTQCFLIKSTLKFLAK